MKLKAIVGNVQINIDKKSGALITIIALLSASLIYLLGSRNSDSMTNMHNHPGRVSSNSAYTGADIMFLQMMIPHHQQAVDMSQLAMKVSKNKELQALAKIIAKDQAAEIVQMKNWLSQAGTSEDLGHAMHGMGGMLTQDEYSKLEVSTGSEFDRLWLEGMTNHHEGAIHMTNMIVDAQNSEIKAFGENIVKVQTAQIDQMKAMLKKIK